MLLPPKRYLVTILQFEAIRLPDLLGNKFILSLPKKHFFSVERTPTLVPAISRL